MGRVVACILAGALVAGVLVAGAGCSEDPVDVEGIYTVNLTNRENGCNFDNWVEGETTSGILVEVTQSGDHAAAVVGGATGIWLSAVLGSQQFTGSVNGDAVALTLYGTKSATVAGCTWTINANLTATLTGDLLEGDIRYTPSTNGSPDCMAIEGCITRQEWNGVRPP